jgi:hypothetical protein
MLEVKTTNTFSYSAPKKMESQKITHDKTPTFRSGFMRKRGAPFKRREPFLHLEQVFLLREKVAFRMEILYTLIDCLSSISVDKEKARGRQTAGAIALQPQ